MTRRRLGLGRSAPWVVWLARAWAVVLVLGAALPAGAQTTSFAIDDTTYCRQLVELYRKFVLPPAGWGADLEATHALNACSAGKGDPKSIALLEKRLRENKISLPAREFKP